MKNHIEVTSTTGPTSQSNNMKRGEVLLSPGKFVYQEARMVVFVAAETSLSSKIDSSEAFSTLS